MPAREDEHERGGEAGSVLIEAIVSAAILLGAIVALFVALDVQTASSGVSKAATAAAGLAEADQERLRAFRVPELSNRRETRTVTVGGAPYTVESNVDWIRDATGGEETCANSASQADYLRLTSTVTGRTPGATGQPIRLRSLIAPPVGQFGENQGTVAVQASGGLGQPIAGATATITGPSTLSDATNDEGCAIFGYVPVGSYTVQLSASGFVDPAGRPTADGSVTATEGTTNLTTLSYDRAGSVNVSFDTRLGTGTPFASTASVLSAANAGIPATGFRLFRPAQPQQTIAATQLFPFESAYTLYSGSCAAANPAQYDSDYFDDHPGSVVVAAGTTAAVTVREPALRLTVKSPAPGATVRVRARSTDPACPDVFDWTVTTTPEGPADAQHGTATLPDPGLPFGRYAVCVQTGGIARTLPDVALTDPAGSALQTADLRGAPSGTCS